MLRCNPAWGNPNPQPRYDIVIVDDGDSGHIFCRLVRVFTYTPGEDDQAYALALVQPLSAPTGNRPGDHELGLCRVREKNRDQSRVLPARAIIRGALVIEDPTHAGEYTVVDAVDNDMFLRCMALFPNRDIARID